MVFSFLRKWCIVVGIKSVAQQLLEVNIAQRPALSGWKSDAEILVHLVPDRLRKTNTHKRKTHGQKEISSRQKDL